MNEIIALRRDFQRFLAAGAFRTPPGRSACALSHAKLLGEWHKAESAGLVRLRSEEEQESYFDGFGEPEAYTDAHGRRVSAEQARKELCELIDAKGCWCVISEYWDGEEWQQADSIGMCTGYDDPESPFENCYVPDLMRSALDAVNAPVYAI